jgi:hypothetical protein
VSAISSISLPSVSLYSLPSSQSANIVDGAASAAGDAGSGTAAEVSGATAKLGLHNEAVIGALIQSLLVSSNVGTIGPASFPTGSPAPQAPPQINQVS